MSDEKTLFKRILDKEIPADIVHEDEHCIAFRDVNPQAEVHLLVIPRKEIRSLAELEDEDQELIGHLFLIVRQLAAKFGLAEGYRTVINCGPAGGQTVDHLHIHLLGGRSFTWPPG